MYFKSVVFAKLQEKSMRALGFAYKEMSLYDESQEAAVALEEEEISIEKCEESLVFVVFCYYSRHSF